jgi:hypothetical protein
MLCLNAPSHRNRSICNCGARVPKWLLRDCVGPLCQALRGVRTPKLPMLELALPDFDLPHFGALIG